MVLFIVFVENICREQSGSVYLLVDNQVSHLTYSLLVAHCISFCDTTCRSVSDRVLLQIARCGGTIVGTSGLIQTPQYPNNYPNSAVCEWYVEGPTGHYLALNFSSFQLGNRALTNCTGQDTLSVYDRDISGMCKVLLCRMTDLTFAIIVYLGVLLVPSIIMTL